MTETHHQKSDEPTAEERQAARISELEEAMAEATEEITRLSGITGGDIDAETLIKNVQTELTYHEGHAQ